MNFQLANIQSSGKAFSSFSNVQLHWTFYGNFKKIWKFFFILFKFNIQLPVNAKVWNTIASNRSMPTYMASSSHQYQGMQGMNQTLPSTSSSMIPSGNSMQTSSPVNICLPRDAHDYPGYRYAVSWYNSFYLINNMIFISCHIFTEPQ